MDSRTAWMSLYLILFRHAVPTPGPVSASFVTWAVSKATVRKCVVSFFMLHLLSFLLYEMH